LIDENSSREDLISELQKLRQRCEELEDNNRRYGYVDKQFKIMNQKIAWRENQFNNLLNLIPVGVSICTDISCQKINHNPIAEQFLRISDWDTMSYSGENIPLFKIFRAGRALTHQELPIQRSIWFGENVSDEEYEFEWEDGIKKVCTINSTPICDQSGAIIGAISVLVDITEKKHRANLDSITDGFYILDDQWRFTYISSKAELHIEKPSDELLGKNIWEEFPAYVGTIVYDCLHEVAVNRVPITFELLTQHKKRWYEVTVSPDEMGIYVVFREITERKKAEEIIAAEQKRFNDILELLPAYLVLLTPDYHVSFANRLFRERFGESHGRRCFEYLFARSEPCEICTTYEVLQTMSPKEWEWMGPDGHCYHIYDFPFTDVDGSTLIMEMGIDITELKKSEKDLGQSEEKFSKAFYGSPIIMILTTVNEGKFIEANEAFFVGTGYSREEIVNHTIMETDFYVDQGKWQERMEILMEKGRFERCEISFRAKSGEIRHGFAWSQLLFLDGKQCHLTCLIDITEQKRIEQEMARLDRLNFIGEMAASIGHEIRNPMTAVRGFIQLLNEQQCCDKDKIYFDLMIEELDRANEIISEYLGMARDKTVELKPQYLDQVVKAIYPLLEADANNKEMKIKLDLGKPPMPLIDQNEIRQVILNLARNGLEAMSSGGTLTIGTTVERNEIALFFKDEGAGLNPIILEKLGTPFLTTKENGTGLGLTVCYCIAARHNARIEVETSSQGTTFKMLFPLQVVE
jgi:PAS domain S-box-containing protein